MSHVRIVTDSGCDLPPEELEQLDVTAVPLIVIFGQEEFPETSLTREEFWW